MATVDGVLKASLLLKKLERGCEKIHESQIAILGDLRNCGGIDRQTLILIATSR